MRVFPARAGMSPTGVPACSMNGSVPRASGDEPAGIITTPITEGCSPRERG